MQQLPTPADGLNFTTTCEHAVLGLVVVGPNYGDSFEVCIARDKCAVHWKQEQKDKARTQELRNAGQTQKAEARETAREQKEQAERDRAHAKREAWTAAVPAIADALAEALKKKSPRALGDLVIDGCDRSAGRPFVKGAKKRLPHRTPDQIIRCAALTLLLYELDRFHAYTDFPRVAKKFGVDVSKILKAHAEATKAKA